MATEFRNIARSPSGRMRSYGSMNDGKLFALWGLREEYKDDTDAVARIKKVVDARLLEREGDQLYKLRKLAGYPSPVIEMVLEQERIKFDSKRSAAKSKQVASTEMKPAIMKAARYKGKKDYTGWLMSEKFDGFRAVWDGEKFISKNGNVFYAPKEFTKGFPKVPLDGELWAGREEYQTAASIIKRKPKSKDYNAADWDKLQYVIFDATGL